MLSSNKKKKKFHREGAKARRIEISGILFDRIREKEVVYEMRWT
jgi:hypothetical protein